MDNFIWYQKYLPLENIPELYAIRNLVFSLTANHNEKNDKLNNDLSAKIREFDAKVFGVLQGQVKQKDKKMNMLINWYGQDREVKELYKQYAVFRTGIDASNYPEDDACLDRIEEYYSERITRLGYILHGKDGEEQPYLVKPEKDGEEQPYLVKPGDYFRKIAADFYRDEMRWHDIYYRNKDSLRKPDNPDLIYPGERLHIPPPFPHPLFEE